MDLPEDILLRTPEEAARRVALGFLADARKARDRLSDPEDAEALHDFRVAIRRLRSAVRAYRKPLSGSVTEKQRRTLRKLQQATGAGRDAEVLLEWLVPQRPGLREAHRVGHDWIVGRLRAQKDKAYGRVRKDVRKAFAKVEDGLRDRLERMTVEIHLVHESKSRTWAEALAPTIREHAEELARRLAKVKSLEHQEAAHDARITCKRIRYLLEPLRRDVPATQELVRRCKALQDTLGDMHDATVLAGELASALEKAAAGRARRLHELALSDQESVMRREMQRSEHAGLIELSRRSQTRLELLFADLDRDWLSGGADAFVAAAGAVAKELEEIARPDTEVERKYLLSALPEEAKRAPSVEIDQGYLPGTRLRERIRRKRAAAGTSYYRTVKLGRGVERLELEEETTAEVFGAVWPLTEGRRVRKRRYLVQVGDHLWEIDEFLDRTLALAEVELDSANEEVALPSWLAPHVVREVTDEPGYVNLNLAR